MKKFTKEQTHYIMNTLFKEKLEEAKEQGKSSAIKEVLEKIDNTKEKLRLIRRFGGRRCNPNSNMHWGHDKVWIPSDWNNIEAEIEELKATLQERKLKK